MFRVTCVNETVQRAAQSSTFFNDAFQKRDTISKIIPQQAIKQCPTGQGLLKCSSLLIVPAPIGNKAKNRKEINKTKIYNN